MCETAVEETAWDPFERFGPFVILMYIVRTLFMQNI